MLYRVFIVIGMLVSAVLWAGFGWQVLGRHHVIPYDPPLRCLHVALPLAPGHTLSQTILGRSHGLSGVALAFRTTSAAPVAVAIHEEAPNGKTIPLAAATLALPANHPFYTVHVVFPSQLESEGKTYAVHVRGLDEQGESGGGLDTAPLAWSCWSDAFAYGELLVDGELAHGDLFLQPLYQRGAAGAVQTIVARFQGIRVGVFPAWLWWACLIRRTSRHANAGSLGRGWARGVPAQSHCTAYRAPSRGPRRVLGRSSAAPAGGTGRRAGKCCRGINADDG